MHKDLKEVLKNTVSDLRFFAKVTAQHDLMLAGKLEACVLLLTSIITHEEGG